MSALHDSNIFWFSGYYKVKGSLVLTPGTSVIDTRTTRPLSFSIATPEMQRAGLVLSVQAAM